MTFLYTNTLLPQVFEGKEAFVMLKAKKRTWRERREAGLSETHYSGLELYLGDFDGFVLVAKLSHGLRAIDANDRDYFIFDEKENVEVEISVDFYNDVVRMVEVDMHFQTHSVEFGQLMS